MVWLGRLEEYLNGFVNQTGFVNRAMDILGSYPTVTSGFRGAHRSNHSHDLSLEVPF